MIWGRDKEKKSEGEKKEHITSRKKKGVSGAHAEKGRGTSIEKRRGGVGGGKKNVGGLRARPGISVSTKGVLIPAKEKFPVSQREKGEPANHRKGRGFSSVRKSPIRWRERRGIRRLRKKEDFADRKGGGISGCSTKGNFSAGGGELPQGGKQDEEEKRIVIENEIGREAGEPGRGPCRLITQKE